MPSSIAGAYIAAATLALIALSCTITTLFVLCSKRMQWNGFILIIFSLSMCQLVYDCSFFFLLQEASSGSGDEHISGGGSRSHWGYALFLYFNMFGELTVAAWTVILSIILVRIVSTLNNVAIYTEYPLYLSATVTAPLLLVVYGASVYQLQVQPLQPMFRAYYWLRFSLVFINIFLLSTTQFLLRRLPQSIRTGVMSSAQAECMRVLVMRMQLYSVIQVIMRIGPSWFEYDSSTLHSPAAQYFSLCTSPATGVCYFLVFLIMQPAARMIFVGYLNQLCFKPQAEKGDKESRVKEEGGATSWGEENRDTLQLRESSWAIELNEMELAGIIASGEIPERYSNASTRRGSELT